MTTIENFITAASSKLEKAGLNDPAFEARFLVMHCLDLAASDLSRSAPLTPAESEKLNNWLVRRANHEPLARIAGAREFWKHAFVMNEGTLEPRPDSEITIETALQLLPDQSAPLHIMDIGTGSGNLLLSLLHEYPNATGIGTDLSPRALEAARINAEHIGVINRAQFIETSWSDGITGAFDLIVSNPPYIKQGDLDALHPEVRLHDPELALTGGTDGLVGYRALIPQAFVLLKSSAFLFCEIGYDIEKEVTALFTKHGFEQVICKQDLGGNPRLITGQKP